jgi:hypothetical protein
MRRDTTPSSCPVDGIETGEVVRLASDLKLEWDKLVVEIDHGPDRARPRPITSVLGTS